MQTGPPDTASLPPVIDPWQQPVGRWQGSLPLAELPRLSVLLEATSGRVTVSLDSEVDEQGTHWLAGTLATTVQLLCQRCLTTLSWPLRVDFRLVLVHSEAQAAALPADREPLLVPAVGLSTVELVEDELLLALPLIPRHPDQRQCEASGFRLPAAATEVPVSPFGGLAELLKPSSRSK
jgi:uncharacterized protein